MPRSVLLTVVLGAVLVFGSVASAQVDVLNCDDFASYAEVIASVRNGDPNDLDGNEDGYACEEEFNVPVGSEPAPAATTPAARATPQTSPPVPTRIDTGGGGTAP